MQWGQQVFEIYYKAAKTVGYTKEAYTKHSFVLSSKEAAYMYTTFVRPQLVYAAPIWHPYHDTETENVKKVQKTAARCRNQSIVGDMLDELEGPSLTHWGLGKIDGLLVSPGKASDLLT